MGQAALSLRPGAVFERPHSEGDMAVVLQQLNRLFDGLARADNPLEYAGAFACIDTLGIVEAVVPNITGVTLDTLSRRADMVAVPLTFMMAGHALQELWPTLEEASLRRRCQTTGHVLLHYAAMALPQSGGQVDERMAVVLAACFNALQQKTEYEHVALLSGVAIDMLECRLATGYLSQQLALPVPQNVAVTGQGAHLAPFFVEVSQQSKRAARHVHHLNTTFGYRRLQHG